MGAGSSKAHQSYRWRRARLPPRSSVSQGPATPAAAGGLGRITGSACSDRPSAPGRGI